MEKKNISGAVAGTEVIQDYLLSVPKSHIQSLPESCQTRAAIIAEPLSHTMISLGQVIRF